MNPLSKEARAALAALAPAEPTAADERRVRQNLERALGLAMPLAAVTVATSTTSAAAATTATTALSHGGAVAGLTSLGLGAKVVLFVAALGVGAAVTVGVKHALEPEAPRAVKPVAAPRPAPPQRAVAAVAEPAPVPGVLPTAEPLEAATEPATPTARPRVASVEPTRTPVVPVVEPEPAAETPALALSPPAVAAPPPPPGLVVAVDEAGYELAVEVNFPSCDVVTEMRSALAARRLLINNQAEHALWLLGAYQKHCASGRWSDEAWRVRLSSLCKLGRNTEATSLLEWVTSEYPGRRPAIEAELRTTCEPEVLGE